MAKKRKAFKRPPAKSTRQMAPDDAAMAAGAGAAAPLDQEAGAGAAPAAAAPAPMTDEARMRSRYGG